MKATTHYRNAMQHGDIEPLLAAMTPDAALISPISDHLVFRGHADLRILLSAIHSVLRGLEWTEERGSETVHFVAGHAFIGPLRLGDITRLDLDQNGRIEVIRPHLRPWLSCTVFAAVLAARLARHPDVLVRARSRGGDPRPSHRPR